MDGPATYRQRGVSTGKLTRNMQMRPPSSFKDFLIFFESSHDNVRTNQRNISTAHGVVNFFLKTNYSKTTRGSEFFFLKKKKAAERGKIPGG